ncbi:hypothetical protein GCM10027422_40770 [Hymenobacter arcticus]
MPPVGASKPPLPTWATFKELRTALAGLNPNRIPTGVLLNRTPVFTDPHLFSGQGDTAASYAGFEQQYAEFYQAALDTSQLPTLAALRASITQRTQQGTVPLLMLQYNYNEFASDAFSSQSLTVDSVNERVSEGPNFSRSPYTSGRVFSVALPLLVAAGRVLSLYVGPEFWLGNTAPPATVRIDFGDGWGARTVAMGSTIGVQVNGMLDLPASRRTTSQAAVLPYPVRGPVARRHPACLAGAPFG